MVIQAEIEIEIPFHDVDVMSVAWHGHYLKYLELARCELLDKVEYNYPQMRESGYAWPVIDVRVRYAQPTAFSAEGSGQGGVGRMGTPSQSELPDRGYRVWQTADQGIYRPGCC